MKKKCLFRQRKLRLRAFIALPIVLIMIFLTVSCTPPSSAGEPPPNLPPAAKVIDEEFMAANVRFGLDLYKRLSEGKQYENIFICPASVYMALSMVYNGADGDTQRDMVEALRLNEMTLEDMNKANSLLKTVLQNPDPKVELAIANSIWAREGVDFKEDFMERNKEFYQAEVETLDFDNPDASKTINDWVSKNTKGKIPEIVDSEIDPLTVMFLINAIYFKGAWSDEFDAKLTRTITFRKSDGTEKSVPVMFRGGNYSYYQGENFQAVRLPYGEGRVGMYVFLPNEGLGLTDFYADLDEHDWSEWLESFGNREGMVGLPKFKMEYDVELSKALSDMGMAVAFDPYDADFSLMYERMPGRNVFIKSVKHKTVIEVNEKGTEASGATSVEMGVTSAPVDTFEMVMDRPFFFAIQDNETGAVLFMGAVNDPS